MCYRCIQDGDHGQPCPEIEAEIYDWEMAQQAASLGEEALEEFYHGKPSQAKAVWGGVEIEPEGDDPYIPF